MPGIIFMTGQQLVLWYSKDRDHSLGCSSEAGSHSQGFRFHLHGAHRKRWDPQSKPQGCHSLGKAHGHGQGGDLGALGLKWTFLGPPWLALPLGEK